MPVRIDELLLKEKRIRPDQLQQALVHQKANGGKLGFNLVKLGFIKDEEITGLLSKQYGVPSINLAQFDIDASAIKLIPAGDRAEVPGRSAEPRRRDAHDRDDRSDRCLRDGRHQVHDRLQRRAGRRLRDRRRRRDSEVLPDGCLGRRRRRQTGRTGAATHRAGPARSKWRARDFEEMQATLDDAAAVEVLEDARGDRRRRAGQAERRRAGRPPDQRRADVGDSEGRERHSHRAVREGAARPLPHRRDSLQHHEPAAEAARRDLVAHQDHGEARYRGEAPAAGRPHQDPVQRKRRREGNRFPRLGAADAVRRKNRDAPARQGQADARHDAPRLRARVAGQVRDGDPASVGHGAGDRADRQRQDQHALLGDLQAQHASKPTS